MERNENIRREPYIKQRWRRSSNITQEERVFATAKIYRCMASDMSYQEIHRFCRRAMNLSTRQLRTLIPEAREKFREITEDIRGMMSLGWVNTEIFASIKTRHGIGRAVCEVFIDHSKRQMIKHTANSKDGWIAESISFYKSITKNADAKDVDRIQARARIDKLLGLDAPQKYAPVDPDGQPLGSALTEAQRRARIEQIITDRRKVIENSSKDSNGNGSHVIDVESTGNGNGAHGSNGS